MPSVLSPRTPRPAKHESPNYFGHPVDPARPGTLTAAGRAANTGSSPTTRGPRPAATAPLPAVAFESSLDSENFQRHADRREFNLNESISRHDRSAGSRYRDSERPKQNRDHRHRDRTPPHAVPAQVQKAETLEVDISRHSRSPKRMISTDAYPTQGRHGSSGSKASRLTGSPPPLIGSRSVTGSSLGARQIAGVEKSGSNEPSLMPVEQITELLENSDESPLILDLRATTQYMRARIQGSLNLCIPTTLLKRPVYTPQKLADTYKDPVRRTKFETWRQCSAIIVYDGNTAHMRDASNLLYVLKKFLNDGYQGACYIIRGGFAEFSQRYPSQVEYGDISSFSSHSSSSLSLSSDNPADAPVIGGCPMPGNEKSPTAFFGNIRQNMDLLDGVGQFPVKRPARMNKIDKDSVPLWLQKAADSKDEGSLVSEKFLQIERREQKRMQRAMSREVTYGTPRSDTIGHVQIAGVEKGSKNRYNNIFPFEHSRVKLQNVPADGCDYVNANFVQASLSDKRYIATQGPIPSTFSDFWNVVWQRDVRVIIMLTAETEGGQLKAHNYWNKDQYGQFKLHSLGEQRVVLGGNGRRDRPAMGGHRASFPATKHHSSSKHGRSEPVVDQPTATVRKFTLSHTNEPFEYMREITHIHYKDWPDFGAPAEPSHLLGIVELANMVEHTSRNGDRPVVVHCSAGCGRTGTFCTVDSVIDMLAQQRDTQQQLRARHTSPMDLDLDMGGKTPRPGRDVNPFFAQDSRESAQDMWLERDDIDLVEKTVEDFRLQRLSMVQTLRQFVLCYETVLEWVVKQDR